MATYFVSYDLRGKRDYGTLYEALEGLKAVRVLESVWSLEYSSTAEALLKRLKLYLDADDGLLVVQSSDFEKFNTDDQPAGPLATIRELLRSGR